MREEGIEETVVDKVRVEAEEETPDIAEADNTMEEEADEDNELDNAAVKVAAVDLNG